jgi:hypothetical protein
VSNVGSEDMDSLSVDLNDLSAAWGQSDLSLDNLSGEFDALDDEASGGGAGWQGGDAKGGEEKQSKGYSSLFGGGSLW